MLKKHVVVVGGGWAGMRLVRKLKRLSKNQIKITLVSNEPNFRYTAALYRVATGHRERDVILPIHGLVKDIPNLTFIKSTMSNINPSKKEIKLGNGKILHYDYAVLALGSVTTDFGINGIAENAYNIKTVRELRIFRTHIHQTLIKNGGPDKNYVVVGAGPTGVELSAAMSTYMKDILKRHGIRRRNVTIELIEAAPRVLPQSSKRASKIALNRLRKLGVKVRLNSKVEYETPDSLVVSGRSIPTKTVVWTAGVMNNPFFANRKNIFQLNNRNKVIVNDHLQSHKNLYVIGDNAVTPYSGLGLTAVHNASYVAKDISKKINGHFKTSAYKPLHPATAIPVGKNWAVFEYKKIVFGGLLGGIMRSLADLIAYNDIAGALMAATIWFRGNEIEEDQCVLCKTQLKDEPLGLLNGFTKDY